MATEDERKLFVAGLPDSVTEEVLRQIFEATGGAVLDVSMPRDRATGRPRGFGFVTLASADQAEQARRALDGSLQAGRSISVRPFQAEAPRRGDVRDAGPRGPDRADGRDSPPRAYGAERPTAGFTPGPSPDRGGDRTLYVGNLPYDCSVVAVETLFSSHGAQRPARVHLPLGVDGRPRGFGFVAMATVEAANEAIVALRDVDLGGRRLMINLAHPRGERPERAERPDRELRAPREAMSPAVRTGVTPSAAPANAPPFMDSGKVEGRRRGDRPEKKKKRGPGGTEGDAPRPKRGRENKRDWDDWEKE